MHSSAKACQGTNEQPWFVLNAMKGFTQYKPQIKGISQIYRFQAGGSSDVTFAIPDGCIDIMFDCTGNKPSAKICGSTLRAQNAKLKSGHEYLGVRFTPGALPSYLNVSAKELISQRLNLFDIVHDRDHLFEKLITSQSFNNQVQIIQHHFAREEFSKPSNKTQAALNAINTCYGNIQINELERVTGISKRTLQRLFREELGISPKEFSRIVRCQSAVNQINQLSEVTFIDLAHDLGFSDQPHFMREFKSLVSSTPFAYRRKILENSYASKIKKVSTM